MEKLGDRIKFARKKAGLNQTQLAKRIEVPMTTLASWEQNKHKPKRPYLIMLIKILGPDIAPAAFPEGAQDIWDDLTPAKSTVQVVGYVGAGGEINPIDDHAMGDGLEEVEAPPENLPGTVAVIVRGDSMIPMLYDGMYVFYSSRHKNVTDYVNTPPLIVHFEDGRKAIKVITNGSKRGLYTLMSFNAGPITDIKIESVSPIDWIKPN